MGAFLVQQPNGKFCRFSTMTDCPTDINMTREDYINICIERARREAEDVLNNYLRPFEEIKKKFIPNNMTRKEFKEILLKMNDPNGKYEYLFD